MNPKAESSGESLERVIRELEAGKRYPCYLVYGDDDFLLQGALNQIVALLLPARDRDLNLVAIDGDEVDTDRLCETLLTSPMFPGQKVVVVRRAPFFHSRQTGAAVMQKVRENLNADLMRAGRDFMTFLAIAGWSLDDLKDDGWKKIADEEWLSVAGGDAGHGREEWLPKLIGFCVGQGLGVRKAIDDADMLMKTLGSGLPAGHFLVLTATAIDKRKRLFKTIAELGRIITFPQAKGDARQKAQLMSAAREILAASGKSLTDDAWSLLGKKTGFNLRQATNALEKLILHAGERRVIAGEDVAALIGKTREDSVFQLTAALAEKNMALGLAILDELMVRGTPPLMILAMLARELRFLLQAKILLLYGPLGGFDAKMDFSAFQGRMYPRLKTLSASSGSGQRGIELAGQHPYVIFQTLKNVGRFSYGLLVGCLESLAEADLQMKSTGKNPRLLLERFILKIAGNGE